MEAQEALTGRTSPVELDDPVLPRNSFGTFSPRVPLLPTMDACSRGAFSSSKATHVRDSAR